VERTGLDVAEASWRSRMERKATLQAERSGRSKKKNKRRWKGDVDIEQASKIQMIGP